MAMEVAGLLFGQTALTGMATFELLANGTGLAVLALLLWTYFRTRDASFWKSKTAQAIYLMSIAIAIAPISIESYISVLGPIAGFVGAIMQILLVVAGAVGVKPVLVSGVVVMAVEMLDDFYTYTKEGSLGTKYPDMD